MTGHGSAPGPVEEIALVAIVDRLGVIARNGAIPWRIRGEQAYFRRVTLATTVIMGRRTFEAIGRPLAGRQNLVLSHNPALAAAGVTVVRTPAEAFRKAKCPRIMIIGGAEPFAAFLPFAHTLYLTRVEAAVGGDTFFPSIDASEWKPILRRAGSGQGFPHTYWVYRRRRPPRDVAALAHPELSP